MSINLNDEIEEEKLSKKEQEILDSFNNSPLGKILDENNVEDIVLKDADNNSIRFQQVALIPYDKTDKLYAILIPLSPMVGVNPGEGVLFEINEKTFEMTIVNDVEIIDDVLQIYMEEIQKEENDEPFSMEIDGNFEIGTDEEEKDISEEAILDEILEEDLNADIISEVLSEVAEESKKDNAENIDEVVDIENVETDMSESEKEEGSVENESVVECDFKITNSEENNSEEEDNSEESAE